jgi:hypothetical protein
MAADTGEVRSTSNVTIADTCFTCQGNARIDELAPHEQIAVDDHWHVAHAVGSALPGWLVLLPRRACADHRRAHGCRSRRAGYMAGSAVARAARGDPLRQDLRRPVRRGAAVQPCPFPRDPAGGSATPPWQVARSGRAFTACTDRPLLRESRGPTSVQHPTSPS